MGRCGGVRARGAVSRRSKAPVFVAVEVGVGRGGSSIGACSAQFTSLHCHDLAKERERGREEARAGGEGKRQGECERESKSRNVSRPCMRVADVNRICFLRTQANVLTEI